VVGNLRIVPLIPLVMAVGVVLPDGVVLPPENVGVLRPDRVGADVLGGGGGGHREVLGVGVLALAVYVGIG
jgi:hypothetical protein